MDDLAEITLENPARTPPLRIFPTGSLRLDIALRLGGIRSGVIVEIIAPETSGKTTLVLHTIAEAQKQAGICAFIDSDCAFDPAYARQCGVELDQLYYSQPAHAEQAFDIVEQLAETGAISIIVLDSLNSLVSQQQLNNPYDGSIDTISCDLLENDQELLARSLRRLSGILRRSGTTIIFTNQTSRQISAVYHQLASHPERLSLKLSASIRLRLSPLRYLYSNGQVIGLRIRSQILKNKFAPCLHPIDFDIIHCQGIDKSGEVLDLGVRCKLIEQKQAGIYFQSECLGKTLSEAIRCLSQNIIIQDFIEKAIRQLLIPDNNSAATQQFSSAAI